MGALLRRRRRSQRALAEKNFRAIKTIKGTATTPTAAIKMRLSKFIGAYLAHNVTL
jgi:hypothetical protein